VKVLGLLLTGIIAIALISGCATTGAPKAPKPAEKVSLSGTVPTLEPVEGYPWEQTKDAVTIKLTPVPFEHKVVYQRSLKEIFELIKVGGQTKYEITERPDHLVIRPDNLKLQLHVANNLNHVLRFQGAVLSLSVDGKGLPIDSKTQDELLRAVLTPYTSLDVTLLGPSRQSLKNASTITFAIYDIITAVDAANNPTKRTTFEWIFSVRPKNVSGEYEVRTRQERMTPQQVANLERYFEM